MDTEKETVADVEESDEWFYNYFGRDNIAKVKEEAREEERRKNILNMLRLHYSITSIGNALQMPEDEVIRIARENNIVIP